MILSARVSSWRGPGRLERDVPVTGWAWTEKVGAMPSGKFTLDAPASWAPVGVRDSLMPMGQTLRVELSHDGRTRVLPPVRIQEADEKVSVSGDTLDGQIAEDPWPYPSSPRTGASLLVEARRLADPLTVRLAVPDVGLPVGLAWSGDRDAALLELAASRGARWQLDADGALVLVPLGSVSEPDREYDATVITAAARKWTRKRVSKATVVGEAQGDDPAIVVEQRLGLPEYAPDLYGVVGVVETIQSGATQQQVYERAKALLVEGGQEREFSILPDISLRAGMVARLSVRRVDGSESVVGRVVSHTLKSSGEHTVTVQEA